MITIICGFLPRHCEERSDAAIHCPRNASLALAIRHGLLRHFIPRNDGLKYQPLKNRFWLALGLFFFSTMANANTAWQQLSAELSNLNTMQTEFRQEIVTDTAKVLQRSYGSMHLQRPGLFRWEVKSPEHYLIVADGKNIWNYDIELEQITVQAADQQISTPALLLSGDIDSLKDIYSISIASKCEESTGICFDLEPKQEDAIKSIHIEFVKHAPATMWFQDQLGQQTHLYFENSSINSQIAASQFNFEPPEDVDIIGNPQD